MKAIRIEHLTNKGEKALKKFKKELHDPRSHKVHEEENGIVLEFVGIKSKYLEEKHLKDFKFMVYLGMAKHGCHEMRTEDGVRVPVDFKTEVVFNG